MIDNALNNDTFMVKLAYEPCRRHIPFDSASQRIRLLFILSLNTCIDIITGVFLMF